jgi:hypothetical protein
VLWQGNAHTQERLCSFQTTPAEGRLLYERGCSGQAACLSGMTEREQTSAATEMAKLVLWQGSAALQVGLDLLRVRIEGAGNLAVEVRVAVVDEVHVLVRLERAPAAVLCALRLALVQLSHHRIDLVLGDVRRHLCKRTAPNESVLTRRENAPLCRGDKVDMKLVIHATQLYPVEHAVGGAVELGGGLLHLLIFLNSG